VPRTGSARTMRAIPTSARAPVAKGAGWCGLHGTEVVLPRVFCDFRAKQARIFTDTRGVVTQRRRGRRSFSRLQGWSVCFGWRREVAVAGRPIPSGRPGGRNGSDSARSFGSGVPLDHPAGRKSPNGSGQETARERALRRASCAVGRAGTLNPIRGLTGTARAGCLAQAARGGMAFPADTSRFSLACALAGRGADRPSEPCRRGQRRAFARSIPRHGRGALTTDLRGGHSQR